MRQPPSRMRRIPERWLAVTAIVLALAQLTVGTGPPPPSPPSPPPPDPRSDAPPIRHGILRDSNASTTLGALPPGILSLTPLGIADLPPPPAPAPEERNGTAPPSPEANASEPPRRAFATMPLALGTDVQGMRAFLERGVTPDYVMLWAGAWNWRGWDDLRKELRDAREANVTPVIQWYFWGEDISPTFVEQGGYSELHGATKSKAWWSYLASQLAATIHETMQGKEALVVLESEFNKHGIPSWASFDGYLAEQASLLRSGAPEAKIVLGFGNWGRSLWGNFSRAAAASDFIGFQTLRASPRAEVDPNATVAEVREAARTIQRLFGKPSLLVDLGLSSHPSKEDAQMSALERLLANASELHADGLRGIVYRSYQDNPAMRTDLWFGQAERGWGLVDAEGRAKPALALWAAALAARASSLPPS